MKKDPLDGMKVDRSVLSISSLVDESDERTYWHSRTPEERLRQVQLLRRINYGDLASSRLQRVLEITEREEDPF